MATYGAVVTDNAPDEPALYGILSPAATVVDDSSSGWQRGFQYETTSCASEIKLQAICLSTDAVTAVNPAGGPLFRGYYPFAVQSTFKCSAMSRTPAEIEDLAKEALDSCTQKGVEYELWTGALSKEMEDDYVPVTSTGDPDIFPNRWLASNDAVDVTPTPGTPVKTKFGLALLEGALADCGCGVRGVIHATRETASALGLKNQNDRLVTTLGNYVVAGSGYTGTGPTGVQPTGTQVWMYATGPITVRLGPISVVPDDESQAVDTSKNEIIYKAERVAAVTWNSCCHHAVLVDLALDYA